MPEHTRLCAHTLLVELVQDIDSAPPPCITTNDSDTIIAAEHQLFDHCPVCRSEVDASEPRRAQRGDLEHVMQVHAHVKEDDMGYYDENETNQLSD